MKNSRVFFRKVCSQPLCLFFFCNSLAVTKKSPPLFHSYLQNSFVLIWCWCIVLIFCFWKVISIAIAMLSLQDSPENLLITQLWVEWKAGCKSLKELQAFKILLYFISSQAFQAKSATTSSANLTLEEWVYTSFLIKLCYTFGYIKVYQNNFLTSQLFQAD